MEASAGLVAGSHNRNELVVIHGHEEVIFLFSFVFVFMEQLVIRLIFVLWYVQPKALKNLDGQVFLTWVNGLRGVEVEFCMG